MIYVPPTGALESKKDSRTVDHKEMTTLASPPEMRGGFDYSSNEIEHQHKEGICTSISFVQNGQKALGRKFSPDFQYLLQKKYIDGNWIEGSSIFSALKVGKNYGLLPIEEFSITEEDRSLPYDQYIAKLQAVSEDEIKRCINIASDYKLSGYASVDVSSAYAIAKAIESSKSGILCRYDVGEEWYTAKDGRISWDSKDINPLRPPTKATSGHAIIMSKYDYSISDDQVLANTWGTTWNVQGLADIDYTIYKPTEAWIPYYGLNEEQLTELKSQLQKKIGLFQQIIALLTKLNILKKKGV